MISRAGGVAAGATASPSTSHQFQQPSRRVTIKPSRRAREILYLSVDLVHYCPIGSGPFYNIMVPPNNSSAAAAAASVSDDSSSCASVESAVAFAYVDFSGVDFGSDGSINDYHSVQKACDAIHNSSMEQVRVVRKSSKMTAQNADIPDGQQPNPNERVHDPSLFAAQTRRVQNLAKWYELGIRPSLSSSSLLNMAAHANKDDDILTSEEDDLTTLLMRCLQAHDDLNTNLPPHPRGKYENHLKVDISTIKDAGNGLYTTVQIPKGDVVCHYSGYRHDYQSQKRLKDRTYLLKLQNGWPKFDRRNDGFVDALLCKDVLARYINDPREEERCNVKFEHIQQPDVWHCPVVALRDIAPGEELFVSYGPRYWEESRMIGG
eukprot:CCRYP_016537-RA/>CCRYP_016537-RA protein AED:0.11 eAED:0.11 QI:0/-1/0/1/-1/1/1/0/376